MKRPRLAFNAGEVSPYLRGRLDLKKYRQGCNTLNNFFPLPQGPLIRRSGTVYQSKLSDLVPAEDPPWEYTGDFAYADPWHFNLVDTNVTLGESSITSHWWDNQAADEVDPTGALGYSNGSGTLTGSTFWGDAQANSNNLGAYSTGNYWVFDLGDTFVLGAIRLSISAKLDDYYGRMFRKAQFYTSNDSFLNRGDWTDESDMTWDYSHEEDWETTYYGPNPGNFDSNNLYGDARPEIVFPGEPTCRYVKMVISKDWSEAPTILSTSVPFFHIGMFEASIKPSREGLDHAQWTRGRTEITRTFYGTYAQPITGPDDYLVVEPMVGWQAAHSLSEPADAGTIHDPARLIDQSQFNEWSSKDNNEGFITITPPKPLYLSRMLLVSEDIEPYRSTNHPKYVTISSGTWSRSYRMFGRDGDNNANLAQDTFFSRVPQGGTYRWVFHFLLPENMLHSEIKITPSGYNAGVGAGYRWWIAELVFVNEWIRSEGDPNA